MYKNALLELSKYKLHDKIIFKIEKIFDTNMALSFTSESRILNTSITLLIHNKFFFLGCKSS